MSGSLRMGIIGLPNVGKSTLFNALTSSSNAEASNYPFCTIDPNVGEIRLQDRRLEVLAKISKSKKIIEAPVQFVDIAGLVEGASRGEGLGNQFLSHIRETDAIVHVVRCFASQDIVHVGGEIDPIRDIEIVELELVLADLQMVENVIGKLEKRVKQDKSLLPTIQLLERIREHLNGHQLVRTLEFSEEEKELLAPYPFLSAKKVIYAANVNEDCLPEMENEWVARVREFAAKEGNLVIPICAKVEAEIAQLSPEERPDFLAELGLQESGLQRLAKSSFELLGLITFLTTGEMETRAWTIHQGTRAPEAAGEIHTDLQKGFIRAEVIAYEDFVSYGSRQSVREAGKMRAEGKDYLMRDGDVVLFLHH